MSIKLPPQSEPVVEENPYDMCAASNAGKGRCPDPGRAGAHRPRHAGRRTQYHTQGVVMNFYIAFVTTLIILGYIVGGIWVYHNILKPRQPDRTDGE